MDNPTDLPWRRQASLLLGDNPLLFSVLIATSIAAGLCESGVLALVAEIAAALVRGFRHITFHIGPVQIRSYISQLLIMGLVLAVLRIVLQVVISYLPARMSADLQAQLRDRLFSSLKNSSWANQSSEREGEFQDLVTNQTVQATVGVVQAATALTAFVMLVVMLGAALLVAPLPALVVLGAALSLFLLMRPLNSIGAKHARSLSLAQLDYAAAIHDATSMGEETVVFGVVEQQRLGLITHIRSARDRFFVTQFLLRMVSGTYQALVMVLLLASLSVVYLTGGAHIATLGAVILLIIRASTYGQQAQGSYHNMHQTLPFLNQLLYAETRFLAHPAIRGQQALESSPSLSFEDVSFQYFDDRPVLEHVDFSINPGEAIGIVGPTGAGKSTLLQILLGLRDPSHGRYLVNGRQANEWSQFTWSRAFAYVPQESKIMSGTVSDNICFYRSLPAWKLEEAARLAHIHDEIRNWPQQYETHIGQRADAVSGGQRQRLSLARAIAGDPYVLILDEPTSALDPTSEMMIQKSLNQLKRRLTLIIVSHRLSTLTICDRVMVIEGGRLRAFAEPSTLLRESAFYRQAVQLSTRAEA